MYSTEENILDGAFDGNNHILRNVRLETGFDRNTENQVIATQTALFDIRLSEGKIQEIASRGAIDSKDLKTIDTKGFLMLPTLKDMHIHIDKTYYGLQWQAAPWSGDIKEMIRKEEALIPKLLPDSQRKAEKCIRLMQSNGSTFARCHCNIDPVSGLKSLEHLLLALNNYRDTFEWEIVAFPQHGILFSDSESLLRDAAKMDIDFIGGLDPTVVDGNMEKSLDIMFDIALDNNKGVDIHLHEELPSGRKVMEHMVKRVKENKVLQGKTFISHAYALAEMSPSELERMAEQFVEYGIGIVSSIPIGEHALPIPTLKKKGVNIMAGTDNLMDNFSPFGTGDMLQKANLYAQLHGFTDEYRLNRAMQLVTDRPLPLDDNGKQVWPETGSEASFMLLDASCSAETVARLSKRKAVYYKGRLIYKNDQA